MVAMHTQVTRHSISGLEVVAVWNADMIGPAELHITMEDDTAGKGITVNALRALHLPSLTPPPPPIPEDLRIDLEALGTWMCGHATMPGGKRLSDHFIARAALFISLALEERVHDPVQALADLAEVHANTAHGWIARARARGLLTRSTSGPNGGRQHGRLTEKAMMVLRGHR